MVGACRGYGSPLTSSEEMVTEFHLANNLFAEVESRTPASWHCTIQTRDANVPNISSEVGTIDVHYPCEDEGKIVATIILDTETLKVENEPIPDDEQLKSAIFSAFGVPEDADHKITVSSSGQYEEDSFDQGAYY